MDSINKNQPEENFKNLVGQEGVDKIKELAKQAASCFFCTKNDKEGLFTTRPMSADHVDEDGNFWFLSPEDSDKNADISKDPHVQLLLQGSDHSDFLTLYGKVTISKDKESIDKLWNPLLKTWFTEGKDDPRITVLKFSPIKGYYWDTKHGMAVALVKRVIGAVKGETYDDSIEGNIKP